LGTSATERALNNLHIAMSSDSKVEQVVSALAAAAVSGEEASGESQQTFPPGQSTEELKQVLTDEAAPIAKRMRTVFLLRQRGGTEAVEALAAGFVTKSVLLGHEIAFVLGQMLDAHAVPFLNAVLADKAQDPIVRHEAAEALGAIGLPESDDYLAKFADDEAVEVRETVKLALDRLAFKRNKEAEKEKEAKASSDESKESDFQSIYHTVDPAPAYKEKSLEQLQAILCDESRSLFDRYRAMFSLRNINSKAAVLALTEGFKDSTSALFRHEIAYVLGQMQHIASAPALMAVLQNADEHAMVRHEAAEALGSIADEESCPGVTDLLQKYQQDGDKVVSESCDVALDIADYWSSEQIDGEVAVEDE